MDELTFALEWHKQAVPNPTVENACIQIGCHYEEVAEMLGAVLCDDSAFAVDGDAVEFKSLNSRYLGRVYNLTPSQKIEILDALCDQIVTAAGIAHSMGFDLIGALAEVNDSNFSKFVDGKAVFDANGKIDKPASYRKPDLTKFI